MSTAFRLSNLFFMILCVSGLTFASSAGDRVDLAEFACHPEAFAGRNIEVNANVIAITADGKSLELFDSHSHTRIVVQLMQLRKTDRMALLHRNVRSVWVSGRASVVEGRLTIDAQSIRPVVSNEEAKLQSAEPAGTQAAVVPIVVPND